MGTPYRPTPIQRRLDDLARENPTICNLQRALYCADQGQHEDIYRLVILEQAAAIEALQKSMLDLLSRLPIQLPAR